VKYNNSHNTLNPNYADRTIESSLLKKRSLNSIYNTHSTQELSNISKRDNSYMTPANITNKIFKSPIENTKLSSNYSFKCQPFDISKTKIYNYKNTSQKNNDKQTELNGMIEFNPFCGFENEYFNKKKNKSLDISPIIENGIPI